jgi:hypothetical protein
VFNGGIGRNQDDMLDLFDGVFLLPIDRVTQQARLDRHDALRPPGRSEAGRREIRDGRAVLQAQMLRQGALAIDAATPAAVAADQLPALVAAPRQALAATAATAGDQSALAAGNHRPRQSPDQITRPGMPHQHGRQPTGR